MIKITKNLKSRVIKARTIYPILSKKRVSIPLGKLIKLFPAFCTALLLFPVTQGWGQSSIKISGLIMDRENEVPLQGASLMLLADSLGNEVIDFTFSDQLGKFEFKIYEARDTAWLRIRHIGFQHITIPIERVENEEVIVKLGKTDAQLREVVVESVRPPTTLRGDTTTFDLRAFIDSTEHNVEDILKKLPGIEVTEDGEVIVNGKSIEALLIEGDDLFGRTYQIGTRNIRAEYISHVQIFENYEENPVLRNVSMSESVALNLILDKNMGMEFNGFIEPGGGVGIKGEGKWQLNSNLFSITSGHKMIYLGSNGNTGRGFTMNEMDARYGGALGNPGLRDNNLVIPRLQHFSRFVNPGLPEWYVDNSQTFFNTVRSITRLGDQWRLSINGLLHKKNGQQFRTSEQIFSLRDDTYFLQTDQDHRHRNRIGDADAHLDFLSKNNKTRIETYFKFTGTKRSNDIDIRHFENNDSIEQQFTLEDEKSREYFGSALLTTEAGENQVFQALLKWSYYTKPQYLQGRNSDFPFYLNLTEKFKTLNQILDYSQNRMEASGKYLYRKGKIGLHMDLKYEHIRSQLSNQSHLTNEDQSGPTDSLSVRNTSESVQSGKIGLNSQARIQLNSKSHLQLNFRPEIIKHQNSNRSRQSAKFSYFVGASFQKNLTTNWQLNLALNSAKQALNSYMNFNTPYFTSLYSEINPSYQGFQFEGHRVNISMRYRNILKNTEGHFRATHSFNENRWGNSFDFFRSIIASDPIYIKNSSRWSITGSYNWFHLPLKTNIRLSSGFTSTSGQTVVIGELIPTKQQNFTLRLKLESRLAHSLSVRFTHHFYINKITTDVSGSDGKTSNISNRTDLRFNYFQKNWRITLTGTYHTSTGSGLTQAQLLGSHLEVYREITLFGKEINLSLNATNLTNSRSFDIVYSNTEFYSKTGTRAIPLFIYLTARFSPF